MLCVVGIVGNGLPATTLFPGVGKIVENPNDRGALCSGTLLPSGRHFLTAAHCLWFYNVPNEVFTLYVRFPEISTAYPFTIAASNPVNNDVSIHPNFTGLTRDGYDLAMVDLDEVAYTSPGVPLATYDIFRGSDEFKQAEIMGQTVPVPGTGITDIVGYGVTGNGNNCVKYHNEGVRRTGQNRFEAFAERLEGRVPGIYPGFFGAPPESLLVFDLDNGDPNYDAFGFHFSDLSPYSDPTGLGNSEVGYGLTDSGGASLIAGKLAGVTSFGIGDGFPFTIATDICPPTISSVGEFNFATRVSQYQTWIDSFFPPKVTGVRVGAATPGSTSLHDDHVVQAGFDSTENVASQLVTVPIAKANQIHFQFSKTIQFSQATLVVDGINGISYQASVPTYSAQNNELTWTISPPLANDNVPDQVEFTLSGITDTSSTPLLLDAEWNNPDSTSDTDVSSFPSGNWVADGTNTFVFRLNFITADFSLDNLIDGSDFNIWNANKFTTTGGDGFIRGDANGSNAVDGSDFSIWNAHKFTCWTEWRNECGMMQGLAPSGPSSAWLATYDQLLRQHSVYRNGQINQALTTEEWQRFADELAVLLGQL